METVIVTTESAIEKIMERVLDKKLPKPPESDVEKTYSINQVARMVGRSHKKISDLVASGVLKTTVDNRIFESSIKEYNNK
ncbi:hypothetical protein DW691_17175 [Bacteroides xylanisolvens]|jgi:hypothetical protein|uniref:Helix-turn-helix domain-containing protein n=1 Tax=Bacteroides xylanisolvens TaxID=371601 RepID=A0A415KDV6_9BACE|nr:hypothetical protein [Bacteroides xylanisolvens]RHF27593.1 hypothetical protein DW691_17175 [Bacteroides xylanisolvens]RHL34482.1 hypothetical protein DW027_18850 [Bacteroides xylanisolvens]